MKVELRLPNLDLTGAITATCWHAKVRQRVIEGERLVEILAGDVIVDLPAPVSGVLLKRCIDLDQPLIAGQVLAMIEADEE